jgi:hypothetical protein
MSVFLRWGVFGILSVAAMLYAYNASKRLAENRRPPPAQVVSESDADDAEVADVEEEEAAPARESEPALPEDCEEERQVAERALKMRRDGEPLDRLLRIDRIAFQSDAARRARLESVARQWFGREGRDPDATALRNEVLRDCRKASAPASPAP